MLVESIKISFAFLIKLYGLFGALLELKTSIDHDIHRGDESNKMLIQRCHSRTFAFFNPLKLWKLLRFFCIDSLPFILEVTEFHLDLNLQ